MTEPTTPDKWGRPPGSPHYGQPHRARAEPTTNAGRAADELRDWLAWAGKRLAGVPRPTIVDRIESEAVTEWLRSPDAERRLAEALARWHGPSYFPKLQDVTIIGETPEHCARAILAALRGDE